ncbi:L-lysine N6-monooxygenase MbtG OS=Tsukamurella paurometabola (strain ATCC 8368 / DSM / CCUG 35730 / CIP 100753 / JCM 10117 / KCTC 9821 / NBRC 16120 / NCIMB 702349 / NCTC 13040) OX=521096 GN=Tpau_4325 PE=3 SV=1 [Tsukamurella paurometabola]|uniref:L-lysine N6-monooxygenase MbtG n=1 Tax=Tsukamurella paurometabola (strain ATCC 8368 / DSM 20162 / CCUG 35730 / CIP 100753 / JCM 10117 / KCTC 9821 / NBRC 16120 / NCIMB 702349 / NCTC 13040) TaxID=521096 RepID=D5UZ39_TSUPD|nr:SidA/IucD/PvdA family monooxygenase [Tsukamurella paurometabola]ADG80886.1 L-lysine 6-monooxygenase (NADPH) [Tsukamurella paurometabola DSM 20162]SUQ39252.1 L-ornithine 5-monooxygenase [Tsukamurella paurometabola]
MTDLLIVGAGPKAVAVAAKAAVLRANGLPAPSITVVDPLGVAGNWRAAGGWTDGAHRLGTSPLKDVGYPYRSRIAGGGGGAVDAEVDRGMLLLSWTAHLTDRGAYADWVDRGGPAPTHTEWAAYLAWVAERVGMEPVRDTVVALSPDGDGWSVGLASGERRAATRVMITGPGSSGRALLVDPAVLSVADFWAAAAARALPPGARVAVIGGGETAASALDELVRHDVFAITVVSPTPTLFTRGESYFENALYSDPSRWAMLGEQERRDVIRRTDRGVFSARVQEALLAENRVHHVPGRVVGLRRVGPDGAAGGGIELCLRATAPYTPPAYDLVVDATGGDPLWFRSLLDPAAQDLLESAVGGPVSTARVESAMGYDLAVSGVTQKLHLPTLAGFAQGPGFANLSCLGELSDRVLGTVSGASSHGAAGAGRAAGGAVPGATVSRPVATG